MTYCRYCGIEISYKRTKNDKWLPCNTLTGEPHFCNKDNKNQKKSLSGLNVCQKCGKAIFKKGREIYDYTTLMIHECKAGDITRFKKYNEKIRKCKKD